MVVSTSSTECLNYSLSRVLACSELAAMCGDGGDRTGLRQAHGSGERLRAGSLTTFNAEGGVLSSSGLPPAA